MFAKQRLYLTADKVKLVREGDDEAATLYASPGDEIPDSAAEKFGLVDGDLPTAGSTSTSTSRKKTPPVKKQSDNKGTKAGETKEASAGEDKSAGGAAPISGAPTETKGA